MSLDHPLWLLALPVLAVPVALIHAWGLSGVGRRQRRVALAIRTVLVSLVVLALAGPHLMRGGDDVAVVFLVDRSDSAGPKGTEDALDFLAEAIEAKRPGDRAAVVAFGREPRLEYGMTDAPTAERIAAAPDPTATDLSRALRLAQALFPPGGRRRIVVLSDGRETVGDARREVDDLTRAGVVVEGRTLSVGSGNDTLIESLDAPARVRAGAGYQVGVTVRGPGGPAHLEVFRDGTRVLGRDLTLPAGRTTIPLDERARDTGVRRYEARIVAAGDPVSQNDRATAAVVVTGPPRVLLVHEGTPRHARALARALRAGRLEVEVAHPLALPDLEGLLRYQAVVLVDVPAFRLRSAQVERLRAAVVDAGLGLVTVGGDSSYGIGGYLGSPLEELLPVDSELTDPERRPSVAQALVIDTSGSMGFEGSINKTDISRAGASGAIGSLREDDTVGVLTFNTNSTWVLPLEKKPADDAVRAALAGMTPDGGTEIGQAVRRAAEGLDEVEAALKHMILFTDGHSDDSQLVRIAAAAKERGITLSIVAVGQSTASVLPDMAAAGGGRYYQGTNLTDVPEVITEESILASRNYINEGRFRPVITADTPLTRRTTAAPALRGYVATTGKPAATVELAVGEERDPLLARWRAGLGSVVSWTSDATTRWSAPWVGWSGYRDFWTRLVRSVFPPTDSGAFGTEVRVAGDRLQVRVDAVGEPPSGIVVTARVVMPELDTLDLAVPRVGPRRFEAVIPTTGEGTYAVTTSVRADGALLHHDTSVAIVPYSAEYLDASTDETLIADLSEATGGRRSIQPRDVFDPAGLTAHAASVPLWPALTAMAALLLPVDIGARRLILTRDDLRRFALTRRRGPRYESARDERMEQLLRAKRRAQRV